MVELDVLKMPQVLSPCNTRRRSNESNSPEFEFSSFPEQELHSADELFSGGVILPLHHHSTSPYSNPPPPPKEEQTGQLEQISTNRTRLESESSRQDISADISNLSTSGFTSSKRWKSIFKKSDKKCSNNSNVDNNNNNNIKEKTKEKVRKKEKRNLVIGGNNGVAAAELNINIWPFRRSRSAGNRENRPRTAAAIRKVSSAPCSRSNSAGESKSRKWPSSPSRGGVHVGRSSPIWQVRRATTTTPAAAAFSGGSGGGDGGRSFEGAGINPEKGAGINPEKGTRNDENQGGVDFPAAFTGCYRGGDGGGRSFEGSIKGTRNNANESRRYFSATVTGGSGGGSGGGPSFDNGGKSAEKGTKKGGKESCKKFPATVAGRCGGGGGGVGGQKGKVLNLNVPTCIGYRSRLGCRSDEHSAVSLASTATGGVIGGGDCESGGAASMEGVRGGNLFNIRSLFTKKVY